MTIADILAELPDLYVRTGEDWLATVSVCLTEPSSPVAVISCEGRSGWQATCFGNTAEEALCAAVRSLPAALEKGAPPEPERKEREDFLRDVAAVVVDLRTSNLDWPESAIRGYLEGRFSDRLNTLIDSFIELDRRQRAERKP